MIGLVQSSSLLTSSTGRISLKDTDGFCKWTKGMFVKVVFLRAEARFANASAWAFWSLEICEMVKGSKCLAFSLAMSRYVVILESFAAKSSVI